jgi:hypothetical protein
MFNVTSEFFACGLGLIGLGLCYLAARHITTRWKRLLLGLLTIGESILLLLWFFWPGRDGLLVYISRSKWLPGFLWIDSNPTVNLALEVFTVGLFLVWGVSVLGVIGVRLTGLVSHPVPFPFSRWIERWLLPWWIVGIGLLGMEGPFTLVEGIFVFLGGIGVGLFLILLTPRGFRRVEPYTQERIGQLGGLLCLIGGGVLILAKLTL